MCFLPRLTSSCLVVIVCDFCFISLHRCGWQLIGWINAGASCPVAKADFFGPVNLNNAVIVDNNLNDAKMDRLDLTFDNGHSGATNPSNGAPAVLGAASAAHSISAPIILHDNLYVLVDGSGSLTLSGAITDNGGKVLTKEVDDLEKKAAKAAKAAKAE